MSSLSNNVPNLKYKSSLKTKIFKTFVIFLKYCFSEIVPNLRKIPHITKILQKYPKSKNQNVLTIQNSSYVPKNVILSLSKKCPHKDGHHSISLHVISDWLSPPVLQARGGGQHPSRTRRVVHAGSESRRDPGRLGGEAVGPHAAGCRLRHARR